LPGSKLNSGGSIAAWKESFIKSYNYYFIKQSGEKYRQQKGKPKLAFE
jgi:hypothetical protein